MKSQKKNKDAKWLKPDWPIVVMPDGTFAYPKWVPTDKQRKRLEEFEKTKEPTGDPDDYLPVIDLVKQAINHANDPFDYDSYQAFWRKTSKTMPLYDIGKTINEIKADYQAFRQEAGLNFTLKT